MSSTTHGEAAPVDPLAFRLALSRFPTGVCIMTTRAETGVAVGLTVSSFNSVSLQPPLILWSLQRSSPSLSLFQNARHFAVNVLAEDQATLSNRFASPIANKFEGIRTCEGLGGIPLIDRAAAHFVCSGWAQYDGGDHVLILGEVKYFAHWHRVPLVFMGGAYEALVPRAAPFAAEELWPIALG